MPAVDVRDLVVRYGPRTAVSGLTFTAATGEVTALVGPNGAGKTTTVEVCLGLRRAYSGAVEVLDHAPGGTVLRTRVGAMLQDGGLYSTARPRELARYVASLYPDPRNPEDLLEQLGIDPGTRTPLRRMSGGEQQRVKCALALIGRPELAFLDEPTAGLDAVARRAFHSLIRILVGEGVSIVLTTHLMDDVEQLADHVVVVARGRAVADGTVAELTGGDDSVAFRGPLHADLSGLEAVLPEGSRVTEGPPGHFRISGSTDPMILSAVAAWCGQHGMRTSDVSVGRRSLEDVVVDLTGDPT